MRRPSSGLLLSALVLACLGAAAADSSNGVHLNFVPQGCSLTVSVSAEESQPSWFQEAPEIRGTVTLSNPNTYNVPIDNVIVQARSSDGMFYSTTAWCSNNVVPVNPQPYTYGTTTCRYRLVLDRRVFGSYGGDGSRRRLLGNGGVQANFFPSSGSGSVGYFPPSNQRATWTVTAVATVKFSNAQCLSAPTPVNTDCWWNWLVSWHQRHHHKGWWSGGRKMLALNSASTAQIELPKAASELVQAQDTTTTTAAVDTSTTTTTVDTSAVASRALLSSGLNNCPGFVSTAGFIQGNADGTHSAIGTVTLSNNGPVPLPLTSVHVTVGNSIGYRPLFTTADCHGAKAVSAYTALTCNFVVLLPTSGASASPSVWNSAAATAKVGSGGAVDCTSPAAGIYYAVGGGVGAVGAANPSG